MSDRNRDALIGICAILAVVSLIVLLGLFGEIDTTRTWRLTLRTPATSGITDSSRVSLDGVPIGYIRSVALEPTGTWAVRIDADDDTGGCKHADCGDCDAVDTSFTGIAKGLLASPVGSSNCRGNK